MKKDIWVITALSLTLSMLVFCCACGLSAAGSGSGGPDSQTTQETPAEQSVQDTQPAQIDDPVILIVTGDGVAHESTWTLHQLQALQETYREIVFSTTNNWPSFGYMEAHGIALTYFLRQAGMLDGAAAFTFVSTDGYRTTVTVDQIFADRYSFADHSAEGSGWPTVVEAILSWAWGEPGKVREEGLRPFFGQAGPWEVNTAVFVKDLTRIEVSTVPLGDWDAPGASIPDGSVVTAGTRLELLHDNMDNVRIYYSVDGSEPDYSSTVYNPSATYFQLGLIQPLELLEDVTIKAFAAGYGRDRSPVATFRYTVE